MGDAALAAADAVADAVGDDRGWRCLVPAADGDGESEAGPVATAAWNGCPAQAPADPADPAEPAELADPADPGADWSQAEVAPGVPVTFPVADAGAGPEPRVR